ncbi:hypothetical protein BC832DRAFT_566566, partial [Gaertneriomyces semiglobifer]
MRLARTITHSRKLSLRKKPEVTRRLENWSNSRKYHTTHIFLPTMLFAWCALTSIHPMNTLSLVLLRLPLFGMTRLQQSPLTLDSAVWAYKLRKSEPNIEITRTRAFRGTFHGIFKAPILV